MNVRALDRSWPADEEALPVAKEPYSAPITLGESSPSLPNEEEILIYSLLTLVAYRGELKTLEEWLPMPLAEEKSYAEQGAAWCAPTAWKAARNVVPAVFQPLERAFKKISWSADDLTQIGKAMQAWRGRGRINGITPDRVRKYMASDHKAPGTKKKPNEGPSRWKTGAAVIGVARMIKTHGASLRKLLKLDVPLHEVPTLETELAEAQERLQQIPKLIVERDQARDRARQSAGRLKKKSKAATEARKDERRKQKDRQKHAREQEVEKARAKVSGELQAVEAQVKQLQQQKDEQRVAVNVARQRARDAEKETIQLDRKLRRVEAEAAQGGEAAEQGRVDEADDESDDPAQHLPFELLPRRDAGGRFQAEAPEIRVLRWAQEARGVAPSTVSANIQDVLDTLAPGLDVAATTANTNRVIRGEVTLAGEAMAAWKFATAVRILFFGWDESTKFGDAVFGCSFMVEYADGSREDICLRGLSILPSGGTSKAVLDHIETRIFAYSRRMLTLWMQTHEKKHGAGSWAAAGGPSPENIGLHRLCEDTVLMSDTCNGARCTKRLVAQVSAPFVDALRMLCLPLALASLIYARLAYAHTSAPYPCAQAIMRAIEEKIGTEAWEAMSAEERNKKYMVFRGDCWQHLRNIIIEAMAQKGDAIVHDAVKDSLDLFSSYEGIEVEGNGVIRQAFKQFHHGGEYCKGRGREFEVNRKKKQQSSLFIPFERAMGSRQDLKFDGCVPLFWNRLICLDFLRGYIDCPKSENRLDKALYTLLRCNEFVSLLRVNTLWKYLFSEPFRWLAGKTSKLKGWSLFKMAQACEYVEKAMQEIVEDPSRLLSPDFNIFGPVADEVPEFKEWQQELFDTVVKAEDGTEHFIVREVLREARAPAPGSGNHQATELTLKLAKEMASRALEKMHDPKLAIADKLSSQGGANAFSANADGHARVQGVHGTNDSSENKFAISDYVMRTYRGIGPSSTPLASCSNALRMTSIGRSRS